MCLTVPKQVESVKNGSITIKSGKKKEPASSLIKVKKGDWVLTNENVIFTKITRKQAKQILEMLKKNETDK